MTLPATFEPAVYTARRWYWLLEQSRARDGWTSSSACFRAQRLAQLGTEIPSRIAGRAALLSAGVLAVEEVFGADVEELRGYGLTRSQAEALITAFEAGEIAMTVFQGGPNIGQAYEQDPVTLISSATKTANYTSDTYELGDKCCLALDLVVSAVSGTVPRLHCQIETRRDSDDSWRPLDAFVAVRAAGTKRRSFAGADRYLRAVCTISGATPSFTFSLSGVAS